MLFMSLEFEVWRLVDADEKAGGVSISMSYFLRRVDGNRSPSRHQEVGVSPENPNNSDGLRWASLATSTWNQSILQDWPYRGEEVNLVH